jgi:hypothetical protein
MRPGRQMHRPRPLTPWLLGPTKSALLHMMCVCCAHMYLGFITSPSHTHAVLHDLGAFNLIELYTAGQSAACCQPTRTRCEATAPASL